MDVPLLPASVQAILWIQLRKTALYPQRHMFQGQTMDGSCEHILRTYIFKFHLVRILVAQTGLQCRRLRMNSWVAKIPWRRSWQPIPVFLPGEFHGQSLVGYSPWGSKESDTSERLTVLLSLVKLCFLLR